MCFIGATDHKIAGTLATRRFDKRNRLLATLMSSRHLSAFGSDVFLYFCDIILITARYIPDVFTATTLPIGLGEL